MEKEKATFIITGEVLGERPMSQNKHSLSVIKTDSGLEGFLLRPLSAKCLTPTVVEEEGMVDRDELFDIQGRSRVRQIKLAEEYGITKYFTPAGGCLLTDPIFSNKLKELAEHEDISLDNIELLKYGRHFRVDKKTKILIGRNEEENKILQGFKQEKDILLRLYNASGPYALVKGGKVKEYIKLAGSIAASYSKSKNLETGAESKSYSAQFNFLATLRPNITLEFRNSFIKSDTSDTGESTFRRHEAFLTWRFSDYFSFTTTQIYDKSEDTHTYYYSYIIYIAPAEKLRLNLSYSGSDSEDSESSNLGINAFWTLSPKLNLNWNYNYSESDDESNWSWSFRIRYVF